MRIACAQSPVPADVEPGVRRVMWLHTAGDGPPVVLIHGLGADHRDWLAVAERLSSRAQMLAPDLPGQGHSAGCELPGSIQALAEQLWRVLDAREVDRCTLIGHSLGGAVAVEMALLRPGAVDGLVVCNSVPDFRPRNVRAWFELMLRRAVLRLRGPAYLGRIAAARMFPDADQASQRELIISRALGNQAAVYRHYLRMLVLWQAGERLRDLGVPVLWLAGDLDYFPSAPLHAALAGIPQLEFACLPGGRHGMPLQAPDWVAAQIHRFLDQHAR